MKRKILFTLLTVTAFVSSFFLAKHFTHKGLVLPSHLAQSLRWVEFLFADEPSILIRENLNNKNSMSAATINPVYEENQQYFHNEVGSKGACKETSLGKVLYKKVGDIYTWTDEDNIYHVSDKPPKEGEFLLINYAGSKVFDYFKLTLNTENLPYDFNEKLTVKLNKLFAMFGELLEISSLKKTDINLIIYSSKSAFEQIKIKHKMAITNRVNGFYSHNTNQAYLLFINFDRTMKTAIHEATHAINRAIIGYSARWLNEGLAEYSEYIDVKAMTTHVYPNKDWTRNGRMVEQLVPLFTLFTANERQWNSNQRQKLYATSWAFIYFMMEKPKRKVMLAKLIKREQKNMCDVIDSKSIEKELGLPINLLQKQFSDWNRLKFKAQSI